MRCFLVAHAVSLCAAALLFLSAVLQGVGCFLSELLGAAVGFCVSRWLSLLRCCGCATGCAVSVAALWAYRLRCGCVGCCGAVRWRCADCDVGCVFLVNLLKINNLHRFSRIYIVFILIIFGILTNLPPSETPFAVDFGVRFSQNLRPSPPKKIWTLLF